MTLRTLLAVLALIGGASLAAGQERADSATKCTGERWRTPRELRTPDGYTVFMERPSMMPLRGKMFFMSSLARVYDSAGGVVWPLAGPQARTVSHVEHLTVGVLVGAEGPVKLVAAPKDIRDWPLLPQGITDDRGVAHILFGSNDSTPLDSHILVRSVWYTRFDGERWATPTRILTSPGTVMWNPSNISPLLSHGRTLRAFVAVQGDGLRYLRANDGVWTVRRVNIDPRDSGYPHAALLSTGRLVLMVFGGVRASSGTVMGGFLSTFTDDDGERWSPMVPISGPDAVPGSDARLVVDERDVLTAFWFQRTDPAGNPSPVIALGGGIGRIHVAQSTNGGSTWIHFPPSAILDNASELQVLLRRDHSVLTVVADGAGERMLVATWAKQWGPFVEIATKPEPFNPSLGADDAQRPFLSWGIRHRHGWVGTVLTTFQPCR